MHLSCSLPDYRTITIYFLKELISGEKKHIKQKDIQHLQIPQYDGLFLSNLAEFVQKYPEVVNYLPIPKDQAKLPKQWLVNIIYTIAGDDFAEWVKAAIDERNQKVTVKRDLMVNMDPQIAAAYDASTHVSCKFSPFFPFSYLTFVQ